MKNYEEDLDWLYNEALGHLGLRAICYESMATAPDQQVIVDTWPFHERIMSSGWAVRKARRLEAIVRLMDHEDAEDLALRYKKRPMPPFFPPVFGEVAGLVLRVAREGEDPRDWATSVSNHRKQLAIITKRALKRSTEVHEAYRDAKKRFGREWAERA